MRKTLILLSAVTIGAVLATGVYAAAGTSSKPMSRRTVLTYREKDDQIRFVDRAPKEKPNIGDWFVFSGRLLQSGERRGTIAVRCVIAREHPEADECEGAAKIPGGKVMLQTILIGSPDIFYAAVNGGTGRYRTARGQVKFDTSRPTTSTVTFYLLP
jgi:hypothetical protein